MGAAVIALGATIACGGSSKNSNNAPASNDGGTTSSSEGGSPANPNVAAFEAGTPIDVSSIPAMNWTFVPIDGAICRDGSATGIGVNLNPQSTQLAIYLEGGGACFNSVTCGANPAKFGMSDFAGRFMGNSGGGGILNRTDAANPIKDWNLVYVPFCTGDVHAGNAPNTMVQGVGVQQFVGYVNMSLYLARLVPTFKNLTKVLLTGVSAGGFGAAANYPQTARAFAPVPVYDLDDSGPPMEDPYVPKCLQQEWAQLWGFDKTILAECGSDCPDPTNYTLDATLHTAKMYPNVPFGLVEDTDDSVITLFYGFGGNNCMTGPLGFPTPVSGSTFTAGLLDERMKLSAYKNFGSFIFQGTAHTSLGGTTLDTVTAGGDEGGPTVKLSDWVTQIVANNVTNAGP
ncbi:MAG TPA: pectin acetylesterase-family hydrolase [Polyangiaceae bacterium]|nr:pectin acetylesterase-family hydrolase [Polyangiaceae bacterium]